MSIIDGIEVAVWRCDHCGHDQFMIFRGQNGEGYIFACGKCNAHDTALTTELQVSYLWQKPATFTESKATRDLPRGVFGPDTPGPQPDPGAYGDGGPPYD